MDSSRMSESSRVSFEPTASDAEERSIGERLNVDFSFRIFFFSIQQYIWQKVKTRSFVYSETVQSFETRKKHQILHF